MIPFLKRKALFANFPPEKEKAFLQYYRKKTVREARFAVALGILLFGLFGALDPWIVPNVRNLAWALRFFLVWPLYSFIFIFTFFSRKLKNIQLVLSTGILVGGFSIIAMLSLGNPATSHLYYAGLILIIFYAYTFLRLMFKYALFCGWAIMAMYAPTVILLTEIEIPILINNLFFIVSANIIGMCVAYNLESNIRNDYLQRIALKQSNKSLYRSSVIDGLTGVANRRSFDNRIIQEWNRAKRHGNLISLIMADIDYFKLYNDSQGHRMGDECLRKVAESLKKHARRSGDLVARYGGEEFVIILADTSLENAKLLAGRMREEVERLGIHHPRSGVNQSVTISLGVSAIIPSKENSPQNLVNCADQALYRAKNQGRNRVET